MKSRKETVEAIANKFGELLRGYLGPKLDQAILKNRTREDSSVCHTHDYCDPNHFIDVAFESVVGRGAYLPSDVEEPDINGVPTQEQVDADFDLCNEAWSLAKEWEFGKVGVMSREKAIRKILEWHHSRGREWAEYQLDRCVRNIDGPVEDFAEIVETMFNPNAVEDA